MRFGGDGQLFGIWKVHSKRELTKLEVSSAEALEEVNSWFWIDEKQKGKKGDGGERRWRVHDQEEEEEGVMSIKKGKIDPGEELRRPPPRKLPPPKLAK